MSTSTRGTPSPVDPLGVRFRSEGSAEPALLSRLIDDAAVFPPGLAPLSQAVSDHLSRSRYAGLVGPLVIPATAAGEVAVLASASGRSTPLRVTLVARPGSPSETVRAGVERLAVEPAVEVVGVEVGWSTDWRDLQDLGVPMAVEVPREGHDDVIADVGAGARAGRAAGAPMVQAKFRTGATPTWARPDERELARFLLGCVDHQLAVKLTGGLHHAVRGEYAASGHREPQHGLLNVLAAVGSALHGEQEDKVVSLLAERNPGALVALVSGLSAGEARSVRACFTAYGCCTVTDPISELVALGLVGEE